MTDEGPLTSGIGEPAVASSKDGELGGTGGSAGGGTRSGRGEIAGGEADAQQQADDDVSAAGTTAAIGELAGRTGSEQAGEAAALGNADGALADASGDGGRAAPTIGDALGSSAGRDVGSKTNKDKGELGGGGPLGQHGGTGPQGASRSAGQ